mgnify:CR=1 FL=1
MVKIYFRTNNDAFCIVSVFLSNFPMVYRHNATNNKGIYNRNNVYIKSKKGTTR